jgi:2-succinyl-5-enolpyruvyl-6-hydroxy-3-cyclohexene-1-carboxylate synthase
MSGDLHTAWASLFVRALATAGLRRVVLSPGSRSTPLALAFAREPGIELDVVVDERAAGFVALGMARHEGRPAAVLCTSGSAAAHYHPAIVEAERAGVPLLVITADRPWEVVHAQASQTIDQTRMFGAHVRVSLELGLPDEAALPAVPRLAAQVVAATWHPVPGPVHVNARFRKPLEPQPGSGDEPWRPAHEALLARGAPRVHLPAPSADVASARALAELAGSARRGVVLAGPSWAPAGEGALEHQARLERAVAAFARATGFVVLAEVSSGLSRRGGPSLGPASLLLGSAHCRAALAPDLIVELGMPLVAPGHAKLVAEHPEARRALIAPWGFPDPIGGTSDLFVGDAASLLECAAELCGEPSTSPSWCAPLRATAERVEAGIDVLLSQHAALELEVPRALFARLSNGAALCSETASSCATPIPAAEVSPLASSFSTNVVRRASTGSSPGRAGCGASFRASTPWCCS